MSANYSDTDQILNYKYCISFVEIRPEMRVKRVQRDFRICTHICSLSEKFALLIEPSDTITDFGSVFNADHQQKLSSHAIHIYSQWIWNLSETQRVWVLTEKVFQKMTSSDSRYLCQFYQWNMPKLNQSVENLKNLNSVDPYFSLISISEILLLYTALDK